MAAEMVAGALVSTFVQKTIDSLASRFVDYFRGRKLNKKLLSKIKVKLLAIDVLADDAELKQFRDARVRDWLFMAKDVVFEAEDLLADIDYELSKCQVEAESQPILNQVSNFFRPSSLSSFDKEIESRMEQILDDLDDLESRGGYLGLTRTSGVGVGSGSGSKVLEKLPSASSVVESDIYGRDDDKKLILDWITSDTDEKLSILSIVGMGGLGKTTLAQLVYNDPRIVSKFDVKAWICVSEEFDVFNVSRAILDTITDSTDHGRELEIVQRRLKENLADKKFLLVLDDIWNESRLKWEAVQNALVCGAQGSKILVTTRSEEVASTMRSKEHKLEQLQEDYCWQLFAKHAFRDDNLPRDPVCPEIGRKIVKKCKGLPLALKSMGSLLHNKPFAREWESVLQSEIWELKDSGIVPALALSYHHLPPHLKTCFAYCALFPKDYEFDKECLIQLWMAENFLHCHQGSKSPEEVGQQYFNDLLSRSFFQQSSIFEGFVMHDLLNDLAKYVCGDIYFRLRVDQAKCTQKTTRHFSVSMITERYFDEFGTSCDTKKLRTFMPTSWRMNENHSSWNCKMSIHELFSKLKFLRVLSLSHCLDIKELPDSVCNFKHLRWLDLSHTDIEKLPESTCSLYNLQILKLNDCRHLRELPSNLHELTNLHRLEFVNTEIIKVPPHLGKLKNLQVSMSSFHVGKRSEFTIQKFGELNLLHERLSFRELQNIENPSDALAADLKNKTHLVELEFEWNSHRNPDDSAKERDVIVIENLQPSKHLKELSIINYGGKQFPNWLSDNSLSNVVSLELNNCQSCQHLPSLGLLPFLKNLKISSLDGIVSIGADFYGNSTSSFPSLERLKFSSMKAWKKWECEAVTGAFPCLQYLSIKKCPKLKGDLPEQLLPLKELEISDCKQLEASAPRALKLNLEDFGKLQIDWASLKKLRMGGHSMEASLLEKSDTLKELEIYCCPKQMQPGVMFCDCEMSDDGCDSLKTFPLDFFPALTILFLGGFRNLQMITQDHTLNHLESLGFANCPQLESLPGSMHILLPSLKQLVIYDCPRVESFPEGGLPSNLKEMGLYKCSSGLMASLKGALGDNPPLKTLGIGKLDAESFPDEGLLPLSSINLSIYGFRNLKKLDYKGLCQLSSLKELNIIDCPNLQQLPEEGLPKSISHLGIGGCPNLKQRCQNPEGEDWPKIAHIPTVSIWYDSDADL
ncbi:disease resistance protein RGA2-like [Glycine soja]|uniref:Putative disease resistance RPP13-like protein 1 n=1 Tax=Glycine soja TaxID=3848 RepID=A0A445GXB2_GLYSO|nr:disease resistance protein RGA2-like [Glycine soja]RZB65904.1 putative disease resistance RPP13-like protein 1 [Glycine soja]